VSMWLTPNSSSVARTWSARSCRIDPSAAAPKITRPLSCPVRPKGTRSITLAEYPRPRAITALKAGVPPRDMQKAASDH
jgi:hypothetical protein